MLGGVITNTNTNANYPVQWNGVTSITLIGFNPSDLSARLICGRVGSDNYPRGITLLASGAIIDNSVPGNDVLLKPAGTVKAGTSKTVTIDLLTPMNVTMFGGMNGNCWLGVLDGLVVR